MSYALRRVVEISSEHGVAHALKRTLSYLCKPIGPLSGYNDNVLYARGIAPALGVLSSSLVGTNLYKSYRRRREGNPILTPVNDYALYVDVNDAGISNELLLYGYHELLSTNAFREALRELERGADKPVTVLEVGANLGYFVMLEATVLHPDVRIHAFEPVPRTADLLEMNVAANGYEDCVTIVPAAVSSQPGTAAFAVTASSNKNYLLEGDGRPDPAGVQSTFEVETVAIDEYLATNEIRPHEIDVVRMDIQGHEYEVLRGMRSVLEADGELLLFLETHGRKRDEIVEMLQRAGFELLHAADNFRELQTTASIDDLRHQDGEFILRRPANDP